MTTAGGPTTVFVSYSRADGDFVSKLSRALEARYRVVFDQSTRSHEDPNAVLTAQDDWWQQLKRMIALADSIVFVVSPESAGSRVCDDEIAYARSLGKRIIAILRRPVDFTRVPERLRALNVALDFRDDASLPFDDALADLTRELDTDIEWHRLGAHFARLAHKWHADGRPEGLLLRSGAIVEAEQWAARRPASAEAVGEIVEHFFEASKVREAEDVKRLRVTTARAYIGPVERACSDGRYPKALRLAGAGIINSGDTEFSLAPELWDALVPAIQGNRLLASVQLELRQHQFVRGVEVNPDASVVVVAGFGGPAFIVSTTSARLLRTIGEATETGLFRFAVHWKEGLLATSDRNGSISIWRMITGDCVCRSPPSTAAYPLAFAKDGQTLLTSLGPMGLSGEFKSTISSKGDPFWGANVTLNSEGTLAAYFGPDSEVVVRDVETGRPTTTIKARQNTVQQLSFSADSKLLLIVSEESNVAESRATEFGDEKYAVQLFDTETGELLVDLIGHERHVNAAAFSPDGSLVVTSADDRTIRLWNAASGAEILRRDGAAFRGVLRGYGAQEIGFDPSGTTFHCATHDGATLFSAADGAELHRLPNAIRSDSPNAPVAIQCASDGTRLVTVTEDGQVCLWDRRLSDELFRFGDHAEAIVAIEFSGDGKWLASIDADCCLVVHDLQTGALAARLQVTLSSDLDCWFTRDSRRLVAVASNGEHHKSFGSRDRALHALSIWECGTWRLEESIEGRGEVPQFRDAESGFTEPNIRDRVRTLLGSGAAAAGHEPDAIDRALARMGRVNNRSEFGWVSRFLSSDERVLFEQDYSASSKVVSIWTVDDAREVGHIRDSLGVGSRGTTSSGDCLLVRRNDSIAVVQTTDGRVLFQGPLLDGVRTAALNAKGDLLALGRDDGSAQVLDISKARLLKANRTVALAAAATFGVATRSEDETVVPLLQGMPDDLGQSLVDLVPEAQRQALLELAIALRAPLSERVYSLSGRAVSAAHRWSPALEAYRNRAIDHSVSSYGLGEPYRRLLRDLTSAALGTAIDGNEAPHRSDTAPVSDRPSRPKRLQQAVDDAISLGEEFLLCDGSDDHLERFEDEPGARGKRASRLSLWQRDTQPIWTIQNSRFPRLSKEELAYVVKNYLKKAYRSSELDRHLYRALIASELYAFGDEMYNEDVAQKRRLGVPVSSPLKQRPALLTYGAWALVPCVILGTAAWALSVALSNGYVGEWAHWLGFGIGVLGGFFASLLPSTVPAEMKRQGAAIRRVQALLRTMIDAYNEVPDDGPFSSEKLAERVEAAQKIGVVWPPALHALISDMIAAPRRHF